MIFQLVERHGLGNDINNLSQVFEAMPILKGILGRRRQRKKPVVDWDTLSADDLREFLNQGMREEDVLYHINAMNWYCDGGQGPFDVTDPDSSNLRALRRELIAAEQALKGK